MIYSAQSTEAWGMYCFGSACGVFSNNIVCISHFAETLLSVEIEIEILLSPNRNFAKFKYEPNCVF